MKIRMNSKGRLCRPAGHNNYFRPADSVKAGGYFFYAGKTLIGAFQGIFHGDQKCQDLPENSRDRPQYVFFPSKKKYPPNFTEF